MKNKKQSENLNSEKKKTKVFEFTQDTQIQIFATLFEQDAFHDSRILKLLKSEYFTNPVIQDLFKVFKEFYNKYNNVPLRKEFLEQVRVFLSLDKNKTLPDDEYLAVTSDILEAASFEDLDFPYNKAIEWCQDQGRRNVLLEAARKNLSTEDIQDELLKVQEIGIESEGDAGLRLTPLSEIKAEKIEWLWHYVIPVGKLTFIVGDPDLGKSFLSIFLACHISKGKPLPHTLNKPIKKGTVLLLSAEDAPGDIIKPRIINIGGDSSKIIIIEGTPVKDSLKLFNFVEDLPKLEKTLEQRPNVRLLIIDPITAYMTKVDYFRDTDVRGKVIAPLAALAKKYKVAIVLIAHLTKDQSKHAIYRLGGSIGLLAGARCVWCVLKNAEDMTGESRKFACLKMNIAKKPTQAMLFRIFELKIDEPTLIFEDILTDIDLESELSGKQQPIDEAKNFLKEILKHGPRRQPDITEAAKANDIKERTLRRAKSKLMVKVYQKGEGWYWEMPKETALVTRKNDN